LTRTVQSSRSGSIAQPRLARPRLRRRSPGGWRGPPPASLRIAV